MNSIIIVGGGAAGLMAAYELSKHKIQVTVLEAKNRLGGRIHTISESAFSQPVEAGAEFIHGDLPVTIPLMQQAGINYHAISGEMFHLQQGKFVTEDSFTEHWDKLLRKMRSLKHDMSLEEFLNQYFSDDKYSELRSSVKDFAGGFDLADIATASTKALHREWSKEMDIQYRVDGGYKKLIDFLEAACRKNGCIIQTNCCVKKISWSANELNVLTMCSRLFKGNKIIITVPLSVLQVDAGNENYIEFAPSIPQHIQAAKAIGFGPVIKIILEFSEKFWNKKKQDAGFIFTDESVPTWWTQLPVDNAVLTGWLGGDKAFALKDKTDEVILEKALTSLSNAFVLSLEDLKGKLKAFKIVNWCNEPDINGGYSFNTTESIKARHILKQPVDDTLFFSGEALFEGIPAGTVEAALSSGKKTAEQIIKIT